MKNKKLWIIGVSVLLLLALGVTYAYFSSAVIGEGNDQVVTTGTLELVYTDSAEINLPNIDPGSSLEKNFQLKIQVL